MPAAGEMSTLTMLFAKFNLEYGTFAPADNWAPTIFAAGSN